MTDCNELQNMAFVVVLFDIIEKFWMAMAIKNTQNYDKYGKIPQLFIL